MPAYVSAGPEVGWTDPPWLTRMVNVEFMHVIKSKHPHASTADRCLPFFKELFIEYFDASIDPACALGKHGQGFAKEVHALILKRICHPEPYGSP
jgi:hypothetical protein